MTASYFLITPEFFRSIRSPMVRGRDLSESDSGSSEWVVIVNESAAHRFWPGEDPLGRELTILSAPEERPRKIIGIVRDIPLTLQGEVRPAIYTSFLQQPTHYPVPGAGMFGQMVFMVRSVGEPFSLLPQARRVVDAIDRDRPLANVATMQQHIASLVPQRGYFVFAITAFALTAALLAAIGIYGVMAYSVAQRTREIGIRLALGAAAREVVALVGGHTLIVVCLGLTAGLASALGATRLLQSQLWGITPTDPVTFAGAGLLFALVALVAAFFPMRRAIGIDPTTTLRCE
jgi:putative ABC transport system permease protein